MTDRIILTCALTGSHHTPTTSPHWPTSAATHHSPNIHSAVTGQCGLKVGYWNETAGAQVL